MKITETEVVVTSPGRNFATLVIRTDEGLYGIGDATLNGRELAVVSYLDDHVLPLLIGRDPRQIEDIWHMLYKSASWRRGPVTMTAIGAVDVALWDLQGKALGVPLYQLMGGRSRSGVLVYGHATGRDIAEASESVGRHLNAGYRAVRVQSGLPGLPVPYGVGGDEHGYEPARRGMPVEETWSTETYLQQVPKLFERVRAEHGTDFELLHDVHHRLTPREAAWLGRRVEDYRLFWLEDAVPAELQEGFRLIRQHTTVPLAVGEVFNTVYDCVQLITEQLIDYIRTAAPHVGGLTHLLRIAHLAEIYHVRTGCHGATDLSPISMAASLHFGTAVHNFGIQEYMPHTPQTDEVFPHAHRFQNGMLLVDDAPGHGVDIDVTLARRFPYERAYLPINRKLDGTVHSW